MRTKMSDAVAFSSCLQAGHDTVVERLRRGIAEAGLDCGCKEAANDLLDRVDLEEDLVRRASGLARGRLRRLWRDIGHPRRRTGERVMAATATSSSDRSIPRVALKAGDASRDGRGRIRAMPPILHYGFRPFFFLAALHAGLAVPAWLGAYLGGFDVGGPFGGMHWHAHEMLFGYLRLCPAGHRRSYVRCRTMSRRGFKIRQSRHGSGHSPAAYNALRNASSVSSGL